MTVRGVAGAAAATGAGVALLVSLGVWQLHRLAWKEGLIAEADARAHAAPVPAPPRSQWTSLRDADYEYRHVSAKGVYDYADQEFVFGALEEPHGRYGGVGYFVMTPLRLADGSAIVVNRGFVPDGLKAEADQGPRGEIEVTGLMRASEGRHWFTPADAPDKREFYARDARALAAAMGLAAPAPFLIDADAGPDPLPEGGETHLTFVNNHLSYALTWFGLAAALVGVFAAWAWGKRGDRPPDGGR